MSYREKSYDLEKPQGFETVTLRITVCLFKISCFLPLFRSDVSGYINIWAFEPSVSIWAFGHLNLA